MPFRKKAREEKIKAAAKNMGEAYESGGDRPKSNTPEEKKKSEVTNKSKFRQRGIVLSDIVYKDPKELSDNPLNDYPPLDGEERIKTGADIKSKGVLVPLIIRTDDVIIAGHNRKDLAIEGGRETVPCQMVISKLTPGLEKEIMESENDLRRGGKWSLQKQKEFIEKQFGEKVYEERRGGDRGNQHTGAKTGKKDASSLPEEIERKSRGKIGKEAAKKRIQEMKKAKGKKKTSKISTKVLKKPEDIIAPELTKLLEKYRTISGPKNKEAARNKIAKTFRIS